MPEIRKPAVKIQQGKRSLFLTSFTVGDFIKKDFYRVDQLDVKEATGMQRLLNESRARSFSKDIISAAAVNQAFLPTSIYLATSGSIGYDEKNKELFFDSAKHADICPLDVVDGQHRIAGLIMAAKENSSILDFPVFVTITDKMNPPDRMLQFVTVNTRQQSVPHGVEQHITARFTKMWGVDDLPHLPSWLKKKAEKGIDAKAIDIALYLNSNESSPWVGRIQLADERIKSRHTVAQATFVKSIKKHILSKNHPLNDHLEQRTAILKNYWTTIRGIFVDPSDDAILNSIVFKSTGLEFFHTISAPITNYLAINQSYTVDAFKECILSTQEHLTSDMADIMFPDFWVKGNTASGLNSYNISKRAEAFAKAMAIAGNKDIQL